MVLHSAGIRLMARTKKGTPPSYRRHSSGQACVTVRLPDGRRREIVLGPWDSPESRAEYRRILAELDTNQGRSPTQAPAHAPAGLSVNEIILAFWRHAEQHYRASDGTPTGEADNYREALRPLRQLYGHTSAADFGPLALRAVREAMVIAGLSRGVVNARVNRVRRVFKWAASFEMVPAPVYEALRTVAGLQAGRTEAREGAGVKPVPVAHVNVTLPFLPVPVAAMIRLQLLTGMRVGEVMVMRAIDLNTTGPVWTYTPAKHKNQHRGMVRVIYLGPQAQDIIKPFLTTDLHAYLFSPRAATAARNARARAARKTPLYPSHVAHQARKRKVKPKRAPGARYRRHSYRQSVRRACKKAGVPAWNPLQLRHTAATAIRARYGLEAAKAILGHTRVETSQIYAERDLSKAQEIMREIG
jgi:integrase